jgi:uncharacterized membrane protein YkvA (DUF1232 family)
MMRATLAAIAKRLKSELVLYREILRHPQTPWLAKALLWLAVAYLMLPFDLIPDFLPLIGQLDDLIIVPGLIYLAIKMIPDAVVSECKARLEESRLI